MGIVIGICGKEKNVGKTTLSLFLGQAMCEVTNSPSIVIDLDINHPEAKIILEKDSTNNYNVDNIMSYATVPGSKLDSVVKSNTTPFLNSKLSVIYGTNFKGRKYTDVQVTNLIQGVKENYEFVILDLGETEVNQSLLNNIDLMLVMVPASEKYIDTLSERGDFFNKKAEYILNFNNRGLGIEKIFLKTFGKEFIAVFPFSRDVPQNINKGYLDLEEGNYKGELYNLVSVILNKFQMGEKVSAKFLFANDIVARMSNNPIFNKIWKSKKEEKLKEERVKSVFKVEKSPMLGEILIIKGFITREQLNEALNHQMKEDD
ncbi:hypothetical protein [Clostridium magnum]|uniref:CobQ/CobB/MinD/ParA nucleotide binding domain protein n=1 Tax=Clostridium magnum DSM 2767 TaxID=1121326 RepID=A0A162TLI5_9CLOT|nr:hypothetical protein [Clostridium magnum]KZL92795.1 hypothetical protein CLMAG_26090 [Clostridium magnum DSM 2767]SHJ40262.1 Cellulose biosynthesis protein BcsQ [Clostridium magnum DSM 2767]